VRPVLVAAVVLVALIGSLAQPLAPDAAASGDRLAARSWSSSGGEGTVSLGRVGPLRFGRATRSDVVAFAGEPRREATGEDEFSGTLFRGLGYGRCRDASPYSCSILYELLIDGSPDDRLQSFRTHSRQFRTIRGTRVGMSSRTASRREHRRISKPDCFPRSITTKKRCREFRLSFSFARDKPLSVITSKHLKLASSFFGC
jgi:hypothetical protein